MDTIQIIMIVVWFSVILIAAFIEVVTLDLTSLWFSIGAVFAFILAIVGVRTGIQVGVFIGSSLFLILSVRPLAKKYFRTNIVGTNVDRLVGKIAICTQEIPPGERGEVRVEGKYWTAISTGTETIEVDDKVEILAIEGAKLIVVKV